MKYLLLFSAFAVLTTGCRKNLDDVDDVHFDVSLEAETFKVGEPVRFHFSGNPDFIIFYSGEKGNDYAYKDTDRITDSEMTFSFSTTTTAGTAGNPNPRMSRSAIPPTSRENTPKRPCGPPRGSTSPTVSRCRPTPG